MTTNSRFAVLVFAIVLLLAGCKERKEVPDVSGIKIALETSRFEKDFFAVDTLHLNNSLQVLNTKHPGFTQDFLFNILGTTPDSALKDVPAFIRTYNTMYQASQQVFRNFEATAAEVKKGLQFVHYYFPAYRLPTRLITFIGPINSYGNIITANALAVGLQLYMGRDYPMYLSENGQQLYPLFISRRFEPAYIPVNCMKNIIDDMYPPNSMGRPLVEQMVEAGKRIYLLDRLLPEFPDSLKTGYTQRQLDGSYASEKNIWSFFVQNDLLFSTDPNMTRDYLSDGPNTQALGKESPGNIGQFVGTQIVAKWMKKNKGISLETMMQTPPRKIFDEAKYKPD
ncbi:MAG: hypothetical protein JO301_05355 [Chitinophagaceae bacterium]|nr:hypothetical protein [Chitinophagaceae bacterium]